MTIKRLALFFLLIVAVEFMLFSSTDAWWRRRRRRRAAPPPTTPPPPPPTTPPPPPPCDASIPYPKIKWHNKWHQSFYAHCPNGYSLFQWLTVFRKCQQDRLHHFRCRLGPALYRSGHCNWTPHVLHDVKHSFFYKCPKNGFLTGVISYFNKATNDRRIGLKCCNVRGYRHYNCKNTRYVNSFGRTLNFIVPRGYTMVGVGSYHSVASSSISFSDRRWMFEVCQVKLGYRFGKK